jgi:hypothetical protein
MKDYFMSETQSQSWTGGITPNLVQINRWLWMKDNILNPLRNHVNTPVIITSCLRNQDSYYTLLSRGYNPSCTSDHYAGTPIILKKQSDIARYGKIYTYSTFACDIVGDFDHKKLCREVILTVKGQIPFTDSRYVMGLSKYGVEQIILESQMLKGNLVTWIHVSAPLEAFYSNSEAMVIRQIRNKLKFLEFKNNGYFATVFT